MVVDSKPFKNGQTSLAKNTLGDLQLSDAWIKRTMGLLPLDQMEVHDLLKDALSRKNIRKLVAGFDDVTGEFKVLEVDV
ncbi:hypothetical protein [Microbulbifer epialgicus]|uniref:Uncharacterized protein n=1 Tax=Microbulbifer epialgicus TaxID=393907 RepID=A0ABV4P897_9GAMM